MASICLGLNALSVMADEALVYSGARSSTAMALSICNEKALM